MYGGRYSRSSQQAMQIFRDIGAGSRAWRGIAPAVARAIVPAGSREGCDFGLHEKPAIAGLIAAGIEYDGGAACARAIEIQGSAADIHGSADLWKVSATAPVFYALKDEACEQQQRRAHCERHGPRRETAAHGRINRLHVSFIARPCAILTQVQRINLSRRRVFELQPVFGLRGVLRCAAAGAQCGCAQDCDYYRETRRFLHAPDFDRGRKGPEHQEHAAPDSHFHLAVRAAGQPRTGKRNFSELIKRAFHHHDADQRENHNLFDCRTSWPYREIADCRRNQDRQQRAMAYMREERTAPK